MKSKPVKTVKVYVTNCSRCGLTHKDLKFQKFTIPCCDLTHWTMCPKTHEPLLLKFLPAAPVKRSIATAKRTCMTCKHKPEPITSARCSECIKSPVATRDPKHWEGCKQIIRKYQNAIQKANGDQ